MKYSKYIIIVFLGFLLNSCSDFLDPDPDSAIKTEDFYQTAEELELGVIAIYDALQGVNSNQLNDNRGIQVEFYVTEMLSDNANTRTPDANDSADAGQFENFSVESNNGISANYYSSMYRVIYLANVVLDAVETLEDASSLTRIEAEARFLRAYAYFNLIRMYGEDVENLGLPLVDHVLTEEEKAIQYTRVSENKIYDLIIEDFLNATEGLDDTYKSRASKSAAHTFLAMVYMTIDNADYSEALVHLDQVASNYALLDNYADIFDPANELNSEIIFSIGFVNDAANDSQNYSAEFAATGNSSGVNYLTTDLQAKLSNFGGTNRQLYNIDDNDSEDKYQTAKHTTNSSDDEQAGTDFIVLRYADVVMLYAEANMGTSNEVNVSGSWADNYNKIRTRAGLTAVTTITKDELIDERRYEFFSENKRMFDLKRFGVATEVLSAFAAASGYDFNSSEVTLPIPLREINLSPLNSNGEIALIQNINWR
ncbi:RagB/SusD family nutrient uptake outer membrane protein [Flavivirga jejuensis]|uniref:RagB/SusD family nutrient uptake outer membrane protein n=1 Tax=Flavivirga jejuensis TaxID=870487 RepID=A0ABT8WJT4_9FLAO|nr:RagB/SusD family nutrient uptake outer membrane protein [Flavivirga jejuensis]MDO5973423.1 RagB/SusD family nutrient uptake outer membrane protein [Flavivirga jejuensis]